jgi:hypothetical protein
MEIDMLRSHTFQYPKVTPLAAPVPKPPKSAVTPRPPR